ncbi:hypothetical protein JCM8097_007069 [Rhodosporidiobolus ruineniae]
MASTTGKTAVTLPLVRGRPDQKLTVFQALSFVARFLPQVLVVLPTKIFFSHVLFRWRSKLVQRIGRPAVTSYMAQLVQFLLDQFHAAQVRIILDRKNSYKIKHQGRPYKGYSHWVSYVEANGTAGRWIAKPGTERKKDDVVLYFVHGGGFLVDSGANSQELWLKLVRKLPEQQNLQLSIFSLDYRLAPEYKYPSQLVEVLAGYHYLVNDVGISPDRIVISGDSAGGNLVTAFLLHLARPAKEISVPKELGPTPSRPGGALLISPFVNLASRARSMTENEQYDYISQGACFRAAFDYLGIEPPRSSVFSNVFTWEHKQPPTVGEELHRLPKWKDIKGVDLFRNPYVNPIVQHSAAWWKEACPGDGKTVVNWGGAEIFADDDAELYKRLEQAGVKPTKLYRQFGAHDWLLHDYSIPLNWITKAKGPEADYWYGFNGVVDLLKRVAADAKPHEGETAVVHTLDHLPDASTDASSAAASAAAPGDLSFAEVAASTEGVAQDAPIVAEGEGEKLGESGVMVEREATK